MNLLITIMLLIFTVIICKVYSHLFCCCGICAPLEYIQLGTQQELLLASWKMSLEVVYVYIYIYLFLVVYML